MLAGPLFTREVVTAPRRARFYAARTAYVAVLLVLVSTAWQVLTGTQAVRNVGDLARFGSSVFQILAPLQLALAMFFAALSAASAVALEKDRQTLALLLLTHLSNAELVLGKLLAGMLNVLVLLAAALPLFMLLALFGGVSFEQIGRAFAVTAASALAAGSLGSTVALWREKTFQTLALTVLALVFWLAAWEIVAHGALGSSWAGIPSRTWAAGFSPWRAIVEAARPYGGADAALGRIGIGSPVTLFLLATAALTVLVNAVAIVMIRVWNPSREARRGDERTDPESIRTKAEGTVREAAAPLPLSRRPETPREVWDNPILWREVRTWAYGRKILAIHLAYLVLFVVAAAALHALVQRGDTLLRADAALALVPLSVLSLLLINAQAVTALTSERDARALDLLLVTDVTPKEFICGKLGGVFYNTKWMVLLPMTLCVYLWAAGGVRLENLGYLVGGWLVMAAFAAMLGIHAGMTYANSQSAIGVSLGTVFFLCVGVAVCMRIMVAFSGSFQVQLAPFFVLALGGGVGLFAALGTRNPSAAILAASILCPLATFYGITSFLLGYTMAVFLVVGCTFAFTTLAMLIPAISEFDVATGRTTGADES